jgi:hypothetical protein
VIVCPLWNVALGAGNVIRGSKTVKAAFFLRGTAVVVAKEAAKARRIAEAANFIIL